MKKKKVNYFQLLGVTLTAKEKTKPQGNTFEEGYPRLLTLLARETARAFFEETLHTEVKLQKLATVLTPFIEKGLLKAFKSKSGIKTFLDTVGYIEED